MDALAMSKFACSRLNRRSGRHLSSDQKTRENASDFLVEGLRQNFAGLLLVLAEDLAKENQDANVRMAAGLALKNALTSKDLEKRQTLIQQWVAADAATKAAIKAKALASLASPVSAVGTTVAQVITCIAYVELPRGEWPELLQTLIAYVTKDDATPSIKKASLDTIGFICEDVSPEVLFGISSSIFTVILSGFKDEAADVKIAAAHALTNSLLSAQSVFDDEPKRTMAMSIVCGACCSHSDRVVVAALECIVKILQLYYDKIEQYMPDGIYPITAQLLAHKNADVVQQAIEVWSTICEIEVQFTAEEAETFSAEDSFRGFKFAERSFKFIVPPILQLLVDGAQGGADAQEIEDDQSDLHDADDADDEWNVAMAASTCLSLWAECIGDRILEQNIVLSFIEQNITAASWRKREAAVMALGCILAGPSTKNTKPLVLTAMPLLKDMLAADASLSVRDTTAWTWGRICEAPVVELDEGTVHSIVDLLLGSVKGGAPRVATHCAWAIANLAESFGEDAHAATEDRGNKNVLTAKLEAIFGTLLECATGDRAASHPNLRAVLYEAMIANIGASSNASLPLIEQLCAHVLSQISFYYQSTAAGGSRSPSPLHEGALKALSESEAHMCSLLQAIIKRLGRQSKAYADSIMNLFLAILASVHMTASCIVFEDIFMAIGTLINATEADFAYFAPAFVPHLAKALQSVQETQLCAIAVGLVGDLARAIRSEITPFADTLIACLFEFFGANPNIDKSLVPLSIATFGDVALAVEGAFVKYLPSVMNLLTMATNSKYCSFGQSLSAVYLSSTEIDFKNDVSVAVLESLTCIVQGLKSSEAIGAFVPYAASVVEFVAVMVRDEYCSESTHKAAVGLLGDLADALGSNVASVYASNEWIVAYVHDKKINRKLPPALRKVATWALGVIQSLSASQ